jgi:hypothetical protein
MSWPFLWSNFIAAKDCDEGADELPEMSEKGTAGCSWSKWLVLYKYWFLDYTLKIMNLLYVFKNGEDWWNVRVWVVETEIIYVWFAICRGELCGLGSAER